MRPTVALCMIVKNEAHNLPKLLKSVEGCFDEIHITDTGSTDGTVELITELGAKSHHFDWIDDFGAARNYSFSHATTDYIMWLDGDDLLDNKEAFIKWRDNALEMADYWTSTYHYTLDNLGKPLCSFVRERVVKRNKQMKWKYFIHEGIMPISEHGNVTGSHVTTWSVKHMRTAEDLKQDKSRNMNIFEKRKDDLDARMSFYYGKELYEANQPLEAIKYLTKSATDLSLEPHDRILAIQYSCYAYMTVDRFEEALGFALTGIQIDPIRAEFYCLAGDCLIKQKKFVEAIPLFHAAKNCINRNQSATNQTGAIFTFESAYSEYPSNQLTRIYAQLGDLDRAEKEAKECIEKFPMSAETTQGLLKEVIRNKDLTKISANCIKCDDIVITCPPTPFKEWDESSLKAWGVGGSETAAIIMAKELSKQSGRKVIVFNNVKYPRQFDNVEYRPTSMINEYFNKYEPKAHIAWRHSIKVTNAPTYIWSHDLLTPDIQKTANYNQVLALSEFHKRFIMSMTGIPDEKIKVTRNGILPERFTNLSLSKEKGKIVYTSSADRGLDKAMKVMDRVICEVPEAKLHVYYGFDNMDMIGKSKEADYYRKMIKDREAYVIYHGNTPQEKLMKELSSAQVWLYPTDFQETFCITALEMIGCKVYPVTRAIGALQNTLQFAKEKGFADLLEIPCDTDAQYSTYANKVINAIREESWTKINEDMNQFSWELLAKDWLEWLLMSPSTH